MFKKVFFLLCISFWVALKLCGLPFRCTSESTVTWERIKSCSDLYVYVQVGSELKIKAE